MRHWIRRARLLPLAAGLLAAACNGETTPTSPTPEPEFVTSVFEGVLLRHAGVTHDFEVRTAGLVTASLSRLGDERAEEIPGEGEHVVGFTLGTWNGAYCSAVVANDGARIGSVITGSAGTSGFLCVRVYDVGQLAGNLEYEIRVVHP